MISIATADSDRAAAPGRGPGSAGRARSGRRSVSPRWRSPAPARSSPTSSAACCAAARTSAQQTASRCSKPRPAAALDTVGVAVRGYTAAPRSETVLFNLLAGFLGSFALVRLSTWGIRNRWGPFRNVRIGGRHIHHFVPGILIAFGSGTAALLTDDDELEQQLAVPMGAGIGLTFDEAALLLDLRDVYWTREGLLSVQLSLGATAILSIAILTLRMLRRGERRQEAEGLIPPASTISPPDTGALA